MNEYVIKFVGLKAGHHTFDFQINETFFEQLQLDENYKISGKLIVNMEKKTNMMVFNFSFLGNYNTICDRCADIIDVPLLFNENLFVKISENNTTNEDDNVVFIRPNDTEIDIHQFIYDHIMLSIPMRCAHEENEIPTKCNISLIQQENLEKNDSINPCWEALKQFKN